MKNQNNMIKNSLELLINQNKITITELTLMQFSDYAIEVKYNNTILHCILCKNKEEDFNANNLLQINYKELFSMQDKIFNYQNRNFRQQDSEILIARVIDRAIRPIILKNYFFAMQITINVMHNDNTIMMDLLGIIAAMCLLKGSSIPLQTTIAPTRIIQNKNNSDFKLAIRLDTQKDKIENSPLLNILIACNKNSIVMLDCEAKEANYTNIIQAIEVGRKFSQNIVSQINKFYEEELTYAENVKLIANDKIKAKDTFYSKVIEDITNEAIKTNANKIDNILEICKQLKIQYSKTESLKSNKDYNLDIFVNMLLNNNVYANNILHLINKQCQFNISQKEIYQKKLRLDGRNYNAVRPLNMQINSLPHAHGSSIFTRGKTSAFSTITLAPTFEDENYTNAKNFIFNYEFPSFATGDVQTKNITRREVGHSSLCAKSLKPLIPKLEDFSYNIAANAMIMSSDGSSSMASVCASSLALMHAGVPINRHVAGIAMGLCIDSTKENKDTNLDYQVLSDINANEDFYGLMDLKIASTSLGISAIQFDVKILDIDILILKKAFKQADLSLKKILEEMEKIIPNYSKEINVNVPILKKIAAQPENLKDIIGQGGRNIKETIKEFNVKIDITKNNLLIIQGAKIQVEAACDYIEKIILDMNNKKELRNLNFNKNSSYQKTQEFAHKSEHAAVNKQTKLDLELDNNMQQQNHKLVALDSNKQNNESILEFDNNIQNQQNHKSILELNAQRKNTLEANINQETKSEQIKKQNIKTIAQVSILQNIEEAKIDNIDVAKKINIYPESKEENNVKKDYNQQTDNVKKDYNQQTDNVRKDYNQQTDNVKKDYNQQDNIKPNQVKRHIGLWCEDNIKPFVDLDSKITNYNKSINYKDSDNKANNYQNAEMKNYDSNGKGYDSNGKDSNYDSNIKNYDYSNAKNLTKISNASLKYKDNNTKIQTSEQLIELKPNEENLQNKAYKKNNTEETNSEDGSSNIVKKITETERKIFDF